ncbi:MAG: FMN-binding protein [Candidatus Pacebacteria bacterium]|nr:FMN-binding protein [Candidatus Paceibacterota bacterium]
MVYVAWQKSGDQTNSNSLSLNSPNANSLNSGQATNLPPSANGSTQNYRDGQYTGQPADAYYGNIQVKAIVSNGKISDVQFLDYPQDRNHSIQINQVAMPILKQEAIQSQSAQVQIVSGATDTSQAFQQSLDSALTQATLS